MPKMTYYDKSGKRIIKKDFIKSQTDSLLGGNAVRLSKVKKHNPLIAEKELNSMQKGGLIRVKKYKNKNYINKKELLNVMKTLTKKDKNTLMQEKLF